MYLVERIGTERQALEVCSTSTRRAHAHGRGVDDQIARNHAVIQNSLIVIDIMEKEIQGANALLQSTLDVIPFI